jgi:DNA repair protein RadC
VCRLRLKDGPLVAACVDLREVSRAILLTEARAVACLRTEPTGPVRPQAADEQLIARLRGFCPQLNVEFADYLIAMLDDSDYYSWRDDQARFR